ncbi:hypothetical protein LXL04_022835 [Taraxacum kok-saghyz]
MDPHWPQYPIPYHLLKRKHGNQNTLSELAEYSSQGYELTQDTWNCIYEITRNGRENEIENDCGDDTIAIVLVGVILLAKVHEGMAVDCDIMKLRPCLQYTDPKTPPPSPDSMCCMYLHQQESCLCDFVKDPKYGKYLNMPGVKRIAKVCHIAIPNPKTYTL